jgi:hypothetical protein
MPESLWFRLKVAGQTADTTRLTEYSSVNDALAMYQRHTAAMALATARGQTWVLEVFDGEQMPGYRLRVTSTDTRGQPAMPARDEASWLIG